MAFVWTIDAREFTSADGDQSIVAEFISYDTDNDTVALRLPNGRRIVSSAEAFSEGDRRYFIARDRREALKKAVNVDINRKTGRNTNTTSGSIEYEYKNYNYAFTIKNSSHLELKDLNFKYWIVIDRDNKGASKIEMIEGRKAVASLSSNDKIEIEGPSVKLIQKAISLSCSTCPKVRSQMTSRASEIGRDRLVGTMVEVSESNGKLLYRHSNSKWLQAKITGKSSDRGGLERKRSNSTGFLQGLEAPSPELLN